MIKKIVVTRISPDQKGNEWEIVVIYDDGSCKANIRTLECIDVTLQAFQRDRDIMESQVNI